MTCIEVCHWSPRLYGFDDNFKHSDFISGCNFTFARILHIYSAFPRSSTIKIALISLFQYYVFFILICLLMLFVILYLFCTIDAYRQWDG